jgi:hypothetical protein
VGDGYHEQPFILSSKIKVYVHEVPFINGVNVADTFLFLIPASVSLPGPEPQHTWRLEQCTEILLAPAHEKQMQCIIRVRGWI